MIINLTNKEQIISERHKLMNEAEALLKKMVRMNARYNCKLNQVRKKLLELESHL